MSTDSIIEKWFPMHCRGPALNGLEPKLAGALGDGSLKIVLEQYAPEVPGLFLYFPSRAQVSPAQGVRRGRAGGRERARDAEAGHGGQTTPDESPNMTAIASGSAILGA